ncbi:hypothetical protein [Prosthecobacter sp.]|uniref:hypothetical protein n=1 Tax=Prosthecobacter sp. TaxID=1965333 RepID=UPI003784135E
MNSEKTVCCKCGTSILAMTASIYHGRCVPCWKHRLSVRVKEAVAGSIYVLGLYLALPITLPAGLIRMAVRRVYRDVRFPYSRHELLKQIFKLYPERRVARRYRKGVIDGYFEPDVLKVWGLPSDPRKLAYFYGRNAGASLRRGKIEISSIP